MAGDRNGGSSSWMSYAPQGVKRFDNVYKCMYFQIRLRFVLRGY